MKININLEKSWGTLLSNEFEKEYFTKLVEFITKEYQTQIVFPPESLIFRSLNESSLANVKVLILGQDPYHTVGVANGFAFSANLGNKIPPSLQNIFKELTSDLNIEPKTHPDLKSWANQGVLLLNSTLTVRKGVPGSHQKKGWEEFTDSIIAKVSEKKQNVVFILWGIYAQKKESLIDSTKHLIIKSPHPSPFSANRGFFGSRPFSKTNTYLKLHGINEIVW